MARTKNTPTANEMLLLATKMSEPEIRCLVENYYMSQELRKRGDLQLRHLPPVRVAVAVDDEGNVDPQLPWWLTQMATRFWGIEQDIQKALEAWCVSRPVGRWAMSQHAVGPIITAGLLAHIDIRKAPVVSHIWRHAGLDPTVKWPSGTEATAAIKELLGKKKEPSLEDIAILAKQFGRNAESLARMAVTDYKGQPVKLTVASLAKAISRRPYNARLKQVCFHLGECIKRTHNSPDSYYGAIYREKKAKVVVKNNTGQNAERAKTFYTNSSTVRAKLKQGLLPDGNLDRQACNQAVKIFLSHLHGFMFWDKYKKAPPKPFAEAILGHAHIYRAPNMELFPGFEEAYYGRKLDEAAE